MMHIESIRALEGPNTFHYRPVLVMRLHLGDLTATESHTVPGFIERLLAALPGVSTHHCSRGHVGGFVERLREGTYFGHIVEHVALELSEHAGCPVTFGKTVWAAPDGVYDVAVRYTSEAGMRHLLRTAVDLVDALVAGADFPLEEHVEEARRIVERTALGPSTRAIVEAAERRGIPWRRLSEGSLIQFGYGKHRRFIQAATTSGTSAIAVDIASDKALTKELLDRAFLPVPRGSIVRSEAEALAALTRMDGPVVVKPLDGNQGKGVSVRLTTPQQVAEAFRIAAEYASRVIVEEHFEGTDYRVLVVNGHMTAASERLPCHVAGDGEHTIAELIEQENRDPRRGEGHDKPLTRIEVDDVVRACLEAQGHALGSVPTAGERVFLRRSANLSKGGTARDVTDAVHPEIRQMCERAARVIGLDLCGIDLVTGDISQPIVRGRGGIVEINASPGLRMHHHPSEGQARDVGAAIVEMVYPAGAPTRIPILSITGTNGKTTVTRAIAHVLAEAGHVVGATTTDGIHIGGELVFKGDTTGPGSAGVVLGDPSVEVAVLETARGGIARRGLGYDWSDVGVLTNIGPDHIGQDGIEDIDDLVHIKSLVAERVREGGTLVLNADDEHLVRMAQAPRVRRVPRNVFWFSMQPRHLLIRRHLLGGGTAFLVQGGWIVEARRTKAYRVVRLADIPITMGGQADFQVANCLAAVAACRAHGVPRATIAAALQTFSSRQNSGRMNLFRLGDGYVMLDYGHNPDAFAAVCRMAARWRAQRPVVGIVGVPGDREDALLKEAARVAAGGFSRLVLREDFDLRGRQPGETARLLAETIQAEAPAVPCEVVSNECEALVRELDAIRQGSIAVLFYDVLQPLLDLLGTAGAVPVDHIDGDAAPADRLEPVLAASSDGLATDPSSLIIQPRTGYSQL